MDPWDDQGRELAARRLQRRDFLRGALGVSTLALMNGLPLSRAMAHPLGGTLPNPNNVPVDTFVILMMENRSVDHYLGWLPGIDGVQAGFSNPTKLAAAPGGCPSAGPLAVTDPTPVETFRLDTHCNVPDPNHSWNGSRIQMNRGNMNGFADRSGSVAMGYYLEEDVPFLGWMARSFNTFSRYFCSVMGPTFPNREYLYAATAMGIKSNEIPTPPGQPCPPCGYAWPTILDRLDAAGVPWGVYFSDVPTAALWFHELYEHPGQVRHITDYYADAAAGLLPNVVFLDPSYFTVGNDDHPARDIRLGQRFIQDAFLALAEGPQWQRSAFALTYDEHGGFYDHVPPPRAADERANTSHCEDWGQLGFRVPTVLASPYSRRGIIGDNVYDHASILKMLEWRFGMPPLTQRDAGASNLAEILDFENPALELPEGMPFVPLHAAGAYCWQSAPPERTHGENPLEPVPDLPVPAPVVPDAPEPPHAELLALADAGFFGRYDLRDRAKHGVWRD